MPELPTHLYKGRGAFAGPVIGGYAMFSFGPKSYATASVATTADTPIVFPVPCDFRLERISYQTRSFTGTGATDTSFINFYRATVGTIVGTDLATLATPLSASGTTDLTAKTATASTAYANYVDMSGSGIATFATTDSYRNVGKGEFLYVLVYSGVDTVAPTDISVQFTGFITGHPNADSAND